MRESRPAHDLLRLILVVFAIGLLGTPAFAAGWLTSPLEIFELGLAAWTAADPATSTERDAPAEAAPAPPATDDEKDGSRTAAPSLGEPERTGSGGLGDEGIGPWPTL